MSTFVPSLQLNAAFYAEVVEPLVRPYDHQAALLGWGSDVLGYDTERSTDHGWGPRLQIFVASEDLEAAQKAIDGGLPETFEGWPVRFGWDAVEPRHFVEATTRSAWLSGQLGVDPDNGMDVFDWLLTPQQRLLGVVRGAVYADDGELSAIRTMLAWYPDDVWRWMIACQWHRLAQEEHLIGRAAQIGDELGSHIAAARQVRDLMRLAFLLDKAYWPYTKWFGTEFARLRMAPALTPHLDAAVRATAYPERETALCSAYELLAERHNELGLTELVDPTTRGFFDRPFRVLGADRFADATRDTIQDERLRRLPMVGSVDQFADSTDVLGEAETSRRLRGIYGL